MLLEVVTFSSILSRRGGNRRVTSALAKRVFLGAISSELGIGTHSIRLHTRHIFLDNIAGTADYVYLHTVNNSVSPVDAAEKPEKRIDCSVPSAKCIVVLSALPYEAFVALQNDGCTTTGVSTSHLRCNRYVHKTQISPFSANALYEGTLLSLRHTERRSFREICHLSRSRRQTVAFL